nr:portal protein [Syntrophobacteraceae bacterium]
ATEILRYTDEVRRDLYASLRDNGAGSGQVTLPRSAGSLLELNWFLLDPECPLIGRTIGELKIRTETGVSVVGVMRDGVLHPNPGPDFRFGPGDLIAVIGKREQCTLFEGFADPRVASPWR